jgi:hypothetical protein
MGAVALKNTVYVLPLNQGTMEDFQWLRREIVAEDGEATVVAATLVDGLSDQDLETIFRNERNAEYAALTAAIEGAGGDPGAAEVERLKRQLEAIQARDYFGAPGRHPATDGLRRLEARTGGDTEPTSDETTSVTPPRGATWVTRQGVFVDRIASGWLIRRFIDPEAHFKFVPPLGYRRAPGELRFDMFEGEFTHIGQSCTFETLLSRFHLKDDALAAIAQIVHDIDCKDEKFGRPETEWVTGILRGVTLAHTADAARIDAGSVMFDALYANLKQAGG